MKKYWKLYPIVLLFGFFIVIHYRGRNSNTRFKSFEGGVKIIGRNNWQLRATEFYLEHGFRLDSTYMNNFDLMIGDSIIKRKNTGKFTVFRKKENRYQHHKEYDIDSK